jgi:hypothetical protein
MPDTIRFSETLEPSVSEIIEAIREMALEGVLAKRCDSAYEPGRRSGALGEDAREQGAGARHRRFRSRRQKFRFDNRWLLQSKLFDLRGTREERLHSGAAPPGVQAVGSTRDRELSLREFAATRQGALGEKV